LKNRGSVALRIHTERKTDSETVDVHMAHSVRIRRDLRAAGSAPALPIPLEAALGQESHIVDHLSDRGDGRHLEDARHRLTCYDSIERMLRQCGDVFSDDDAALSGDSFENRGVIVTRETGGPNTNDIERRVSAPEPGNDVTAEVLVSCTPQQVVERTGEIGRRMAPGATALRAVLLEEAMSTLFSVIGGTAIRPCAEAGSTPSATEPIDDTSPGKLMEGVLAAFAQFNNDVRSDRTLAGCPPRSNSGPQSQHLAKMSPCEYPTEHVDESLRKHVEYVASCLPSGNRRDRAAGPR
jgi:hypothetical protein